MKPTPAESIRQEHIDEGVIPSSERKIFETMSIHAYLKNRAKRGVPPLTDYQHGYLLSERMIDAIFGERGKSPARNYPK